MNKTVHAFADVTGTATFVIQGSAFPANRTPYNGEAWVSPDQDFNCATRCE